MYYLCNQKKKKKCKNKIKLKKFLSPKNFFMKKEVKEKSYLAI